MVSDTCDHTCNPMLVLKVRSSDTVSAGKLLAGGATGGFLNATDSTAIIGAMAMEAASDSAQYFRAMFFGTAYFAVSDTIDCGVAVCFSNATTVAADSDANSAIGVLLDPESDSALLTTRYHRVFLSGRWCIETATYVGK